MKFFYYWTNFASVWLMGLNAGTNGSWLMYFVFIAIWIFTESKLDKIRSEQAELEVISKIPHDVVRAFRKKNNGPIIDV